MESTGPSRPRVRADEELSTFVRRKDEIVRNTHVRHTRLVPRRNRATQRLETSVCRSSALTDEALWAICSKHFDAHTDAPAIGRGAARAAVVYAEELSLDADGTPYPEHANIVGWHEEPGRPDHELKSGWMDKAQRMAKEFKYLPRPRPT